MLCLALALSAPADTQDSGPDLATTLSYIKKYLLEDCYYTYTQDGGGYVKYLDVAFSGVGMDTVLTYTEVSAAYNGNSGQVRRSIRFKDIDVDRVAVRENVFVGVFPVNSPKYVGLIACPDPEIRTRLVKAFKRAAQLCGANIDPFSSATP
jgi:hypothetical protein